MGQVCTRDDEVDKQGGNAPTHVPQVKDPEPPRMKPAAVVQDPPKEHSPPKPDNVTNLAQSKIEDVHVDAKNLEPCQKMNLVNPQVQRRLDGLKPVRAEDFPELRLRYQASTSTGQPVRDRKSGATYQGQLHRGVPHGWGKYVQADGGVLEGFFEEGHPQGYVRRFAAPLAAGYDGYLHNGQPHGKGAQFDDKGNVTDCANWVNGQPQGFLTTKDPNGVLVFSGSLVGGKKQGKCTWYSDQQKAVLEGEFKDDLLEGRGLKKFDNGQVYDGEFKRGVEEGRGILTMIDGRKFEGPFSNGKANGKGFLITDEGRRIEQTWKDGKRA